MSEHVPEDTEAIYAKLRAKGEAVLKPEQVWMTSTLRKFANRQGLRIVQSKGPYSTMVYLIRPGHAYEKYAPDQEKV